MTMAWTSTRTRRPMLSVRPHITSSVPAIDWSWSFLSPPPTAFRHCLASYTWAFDLDIPAFEEGQQRPGWVAKLDNGGHLHGNRIYTGHTQRSSPPPQILPFSFAIPRDS